MSKLRRRFIELSSLLFGISFTFLSTAQLNWVGNGGFEEYTNCPSNDNDIDVCIGWDTLRNEGGGNPDFNNTCFGDIGEFGVPQNINGFQYPKSGNGYIDIFSYCNNPNIFTQREYAQGQLIKNLENGKVYCVTYFTSFCYDYSKYAIDRMGAYLDNGSISAPNYGVANVTPQVESLSIQNGGVYLTDTLSWMKIQGTFTATGNESFITVGSFVPQATTNTLAYGGCFECGSYYYVDDVSVIDITTQAFAGNDTLIGAGDSVFIGITDVGDNFKWYANGILIHEGSEAGIWVKPTETTKYVCEQHVCSYVTKDTVEVKVSGVGIQSVGSRQGYEAMLLSNPSSSGQLRIHAPSSDGIQVRVLNVSGSVDTSRTYGMYLHNQNTGNHVFETTETVFESGVYMVEITDVNTNQMVVLKWVVL